MSEPIKLYKQDGAWWAKLVDHSGHEVPNIYGIGVRMNSALGELVMEARERLGLQIAVQGEPGQWVPLL